MCTTSNIQKVLFDLQLFCPEIKKWNGSTGSVAAVLSSGPEFEFHSLLFVCCLLL